MTSSEKPVSEKKSAFLSAMDTAVESLLKLKSNIKITGDRIEVDGVTVIPISKLSLGFAGGGADISDKDKHKYKNPTGVGSGVTETPIAFLVIEDGKVRIVPVEEDRKDKLYTDTLFSIVDEIKKRIAERKKEGKKSSD